MVQGQKEIIRMRVVSTAFTTLALAVFKPFGLEAWHWQGYMHLLNIFVLGVAVCMLTDAVMRYVVRKPVCMDDSRRDVNYFIRSNLYFQFINTLLVSLMICLYRHFVLSDRILANRLSWGNFFETLLIIAFCSFAIGLYWRFRFRSRYLAAELEETRQLNAQLKAMQMLAETKAQTLEAAMTQPTEAPEEQPSGLLTLTGTTSENVTLNIADLLFVETIGNYVKVCHLCEKQQGNTSAGSGGVRSDMLRATSRQMEENLRRYPMIVRCHRAFLVNLAQVEQIVAKSGSMHLIIKYSHDNIPVSRSNVSRVKDAISALSRNFKPS